MSAPQVALYNEFNREEVIVLKSGNVSSSWLHKTFRFSSYNKDVWLTALEGYEMVDPDKEGFFHLHPGSKFVVGGRPTKKSFKPGDPEVC